jgi:hypothetical protein
LIRHDYFFRKIWRGADPKAAPQKVLLQRHSALIAANNSPLNGGEYLLPAPGGTGGNREFYRRRTDGRGFLFLGGFSFSNT